LREFAEFALKVSCLLCQWIADWKAWRALPKRLCFFRPQFIPKCRRKVLYQQIRRELGEVSRSLSVRWECKVEEGHLMSDHVHMLLSVPPKHSVSNVMGFIKGKSAIHIARVYAGRRRNYVGQHFWARGYWVSTVGKDEAAVRQYIQDQEKEDRRLEQLEMVAL
jgi:putative transposase